MIGSKDFFEELMDGEEYAVVMMRMDAYHEMHESLKERATLTIRQVDNSLRNDEVHLHLVKQVSKAKRALSNYEFDKRN